MTRSIKGREERVFFVFVFKCAPQPVRSAGPLGVTNGTPFPSTASVSTHPPPSRPLSPLGRAFDLLCVQELVRAANTKVGFLEDQLEQKKVRKFLRAPPLKAQAGTAPSNA